MSKLTLTKTINVPAERVWEILADFGNVPRFHPMVTSSPILSADDRGLGARRRCDFHSGASVVEEVTHWIEGRGFTVVLSEMSMPMRRATASLRLNRTVAATTEVILEMDYAVKFGPLGWLMDRLMMRAMMLRMLHRVLDGLERHALTGEIVGGDRAAEPALAN